MACEILLGIGLIAMVGGFGGTLAVKHAGFAIGGAAGAVMVVLSFIIPC